MVQNRRATGTATSMAVGLAIGAATALFILGIAATLIAWLVLGGRMPVSGIGYGVMVAHLLAVCIGGLIASKAIKHRKMFVCLIIGCVYYLCLIGCTAMFFGGRYQGMGITALIIAVASGLTGWLISRGDNHRNKRYKKYRNR